MAYLPLRDAVYLMDDLSIGLLDNITHLQEHVEHRGRLFVTIDTVSPRRGAYARAADGAAPVCRGAA